MVRKASDAEIFKSIYQQLAVEGNLVSPRGQLVLEAENFTYVLPPYVRFQSFVCRKLSLKYIKREFLWYLKGDKYDTSITMDAKLWKEMIGFDGSIASNYGQYLFAGPKQFDNVVETLAADRDSRRAYMMILADRHLELDAKDVPCTIGLGFRIRKNFLNMSVHMRSQDAIFGMGNDAPAFSFIHEMMLNALRRHYPDLGYGDYHHIADSFHVYEKHFGMLERLTGLRMDDRHEGEPIDGWEPNEYIPIDCPRLSGPDEVDFIRALDFSSVPEGFAFARWLST